MEMGRLQKWEKRIESQTKKLACQLLGYSDGHHWQSMVVEVDTQNPGHILKTTTD